MTEKKYPGFELKVTVKKHYNDASGAEKCDVYQVVHKSEEFELLFHDEENEEYIFHSPEGITVRLQEYDYSNQGRLTFIADFPEYFRAHNMTDSNDNESTEFEYGFEITLDSEAKTDFVQAKKETAQLPGFKLEVTGYKGKLIPDPETTDMSGTFKQEVGFKKEYTEKDFFPLFCDSASGEYICRSAEGITLMFSVDENGNEKTRTEFTFSNFDEYFKKHSDEKSGMYYCSYDGSFQIR